LASAQCEPLLERYAATRVGTHLRAAVTAVRDRIGAGDVPPGVGDPALYIGLASASLVAEDRPSLVPVINATGVVLHTNLGRAPLSPAAVEAMAAVAAGYSNLEFDLVTGTRGSRYTHCTDLLTELTGAEDALVVNNCAAALVLAMNTLAQGRGVVVSRGELVEIGGGFRIPEMLARSGAELLEVGSTNRTRLADYRAAVEEAGPGAILKVHRSNFRISGFTEEATLAELAQLGKDLEVPVVHDLGSGLLAEPSVLGLPDEPRPSASVAAGADVVVFSGDKLLGGPQAGLVVGRAEFVSRMRRNPLCRALRVDKGTLAALAATLGLYRDPERAIRENPTLRTLARSVASLTERAETLVDGAGQRGVPMSVVPSTGAVGGGTFPGVALESRALRLDPAAGSAERIAERLRSGSPPVVARREDGALLLDLRTVEPDQDERLLDALVRAVAPSDDT
jgi:L-seryl-tRNA(Ser) seleniumtransferase